MGWKRMGSSIIKIMLICLAIVIFVSSVIVQIKFENCIKEQKAINGLLENRKRIRYTPAMLYVLVNTNNNHIDTEAFNIAFDEIGGYQGKKIIPYAIMQKYINHCYFSKEEKIEYIKQKRILLPAQRPPHAGRSVQIMR